MSVRQSFAAGVSPSRPVRFGMRRFGGRASRCRAAFTLIELILVMALLTMAVGLTAPTLSHFFRGRSLELEARRMLALTRAGQSRAVSEGVPMDLWINTASRQYGLEVEPTYESSDAKAVSFDLDNNLKMEVVSQPAAPAAQTSSSRKTTMGTPSVLHVTQVHPELPTIRFLPDGSLGENSPRALRLTGRDGEMLSVARTENGLGFEVTSGKND
jgi:Tfp pilus assembly protein FimT